MERRSLAIIVFSVAGVYLAVMLAVAVFHTHPPTLGWIGLGVLTLILMVAGTAVVVFFPRARTSAVRVHPHPDDRYRLLVVADADVEPGELRDAVEVRLIGRRGEVIVVAPVITPSPVHFLAEDEVREQAAADERLTRMLGTLAHAGIAARGIVGTDDPLQATADALVGFPADEILLISRLETGRQWQEHDFEKLARDLFGVHVTTVYAPAPALTVR